MKRLCTLFVVGYAISVATADAATFYTSQNGDDGYSCGQAQSPSSTKRTINGAVACLAAGDTLYVGGGTYDESLRDAPSGTSWDNTVRIAAYPGETVWLTPSSSAFVIDLFGTQQYIEFDGINLDSTYTQYGNVKIEGYANGSYTGNAHHIRIQNAELIGGSNGNQILTTADVPGIIGGNEFINLTIHGGVGYAFYIDSSDNLIDGCNIYDVSMAGIHIYSGYGTATNNNIIRNNTIHDVTRTADYRLWGIIVASGSGNQVYNNLIYNLTLTWDANAGILVSSTSNTNVYNNTVYGTAAWGIFVANDASATTIINNIAYANALGDYFDNGQDTTTATNIFGTDPMFQDVSANDYQLQPGSPAIDAGSTIALVTTDLIGTPRPDGAAHDIGAYEFQALGSGTPRAPSAPGTAKH